MTTESKLHSAVTAVSVTNMRNRVINRAVFNLIVESNFAFALVLHY